MAQFSSKMIPLSRIAKESPFCWRRSLEDGALADSVRRFGVLTPVMVRERNGRYQVVAGHKRAAAARSLRMKEIPAVLAGPEFSEKELFILALVSNWRQDASEMDRAKAVAKAVRGFGMKTKEVLDTVLPHLGLPSGQGTVDLCLGADAMLPALKSFLEERKVPLRNCGALLRFSQKDQESFARKIGEKMKLSVSQLAQAAEWLADIMKRDGKGLDAVLKAGVLTEALEHGKLDPRTRADRFFEALKKVRYPRYKACLERFEEVRGKFPGELKGVGIDPASGFEEQGIDLRARLKTPGDLDRILQKLSESRSALNSLFDLKL